MGRGKAVTVYTRARDYESHSFYVFDAGRKIVMCKLCNTRIDWERKDSCEKHINGNTHKEKKVAAKEGLKRQVSLEDSLNTAKRHKTEKEEFASSTVQAFLQANIPLNKLDCPSIRKWMESDVPGSAALPLANTLRKNYVPKAQEDYEQTVRAAVAGRKIVVHCDETTDRRGDAVFIILFRLLSETTGPPKLVVAAVKILPNANAQECCQAIVKSLERYAVQYRDVVGIATDSARYMTKCVETLRGLIPEKLIHIQCWAHKLDLVAKLGQRELTSLNECVTQTKNAFLNTRKRKHRYLKYLRDKYKSAEKAAKLFPSPVITRWGSWLKSVTYIEEYLGDLVDYLKSVDCSLVSDSKALQYFKDLTPGKIRAIQCEPSFATEHTTALSKLITLLEGSNYPTAHKLIPKVREVLDEFELTSKLTVGPKTKAALQNLSGETLTAVQKKIKALSLKSSEKVKDLLKKDPASKVFEATMKLFYLPNILSNKVDVKLMDKVNNLVLLDGITESDFLKSYKSFQTKVKDVVGESTIDGDDITTSVLGGMLEDEDHSKFGSKCLQAVWLSTANVDSERGFSAYGDIQSDRRVSLAPNSIETALSLYFGDSLTDE